MTTWPYMVYYLPQIMTQIMTHKKKYLKDAIYCFFYRTNLAVNGKNSLYWETRDRNTSGR